MNKEALYREDADAREAARSVFDRPLVLEAGAGTGKTAALVSRVLAWCLTQGWERAADASGADAPEAVAARVLDRVVAITFTERAAAEMEERVARALGKLLRGEEVIGLPPAALPLAEDELHRRAEALLFQRDRLCLATIHGFCRRLLATHALEAGLHPAFAVDAEGTRLRAIVEEVLIEAIAAGLGATADPDLLLLAVREIGPAELAEALEQFLWEGVTPEALEADPYAPELLEALRTSLLAEIDGVAPDMAAVFEPCRGKKNYALGVRITDLFRHLDAGLRARASAEELAELFQAGEVQAALGDLKKWSGEISKTCCKAMGAALAERLPAICGALHSRLRFLRHMDPELMGAGRRVLARLLAEVRSRLRARGCVTFGDLLREAERLLRESSAVCARVRASIDLLLVDEFQDTDPLQYEIVRLLALEGDAETRPRLFLVGDPKQSIYAWRSADLGAYGGFLEKLIVAGGEKRELCMNFRSTPPILAEVERLLAPIMLERPGLQPAFQELLPCKKLRDAPPFKDAARRPVEHWGSWALSDPARAPRPPWKTSAKEARQIEAAAIARDLVALRREQNLPLKKVALLLRVTSNQEIYLAALRAANIPYVVERDRSYYQRREVLDASALVRCVLDPNDQVALVAFLRSPQVGVPDAAWLPLWNHGFPGLMSALDADSLPRLRAIARGLPEALPTDIPGLEALAGWEKSFEAALCALAALRRSFREDPADLFVEKLRDLFLSEELEAARFLGLHRLANLERFFGRLLETLLEGDVGALLRELRAGARGEREAEVGAPGDETLDAVRVLTIHKAKGLEFDHVYLADLHHRNSGPPGGGAEARLQRWDGGWEMTLFGASSLGWGAALEHREAVGAAEEVRTLYVAATRAAQRLVLAGCWGDPAKTWTLDGASSHLQLLSQRQGDAPDLFGLFARACKGEAPLTDADGVLWRLAATGGAEAQALSSGSPHGALTVEAARRESALLLDRRRAAAARMQLPLKAVASGHGADPSDAEPVSSPRQADGPAPRITRAVGTAVHRALELLDLRADFERALADRREALTADLRPHVTAAELPAALTEAQRVFDRFASSPLAERLRSLAPHVLARELPVLLAGEGDPVGVTIGTIDLLYRDPESDELVVADFKTDRVAAGALPARAELYAPQGRTYCAAVGSAFGTDEPPRFELWFLDGGAIVA